MDSGFAEIALKIIIILGSAKLLAVLVERLGQSPVVGELLLGMILGPYLLGWIDPKSPILAFLAEIGIIVLAFYLGLIADLERLLQARRPAVRVATLGMLLPLALTVLYAHLLGLSWGAALFLGAALTATSLVKSGHLLWETKMLHTLTGSIILGAALLDDLVALWMLAGFHAWLTARPFSWMEFIFEGALSLIVLCLSLALGVRWAPQLFRIIERLETRGMLIVASLVFCLALAVLAESLGLAVVVGAFAAGLMLEYIPQERKITRQVETLVDLFVPFYFVKAGAVLNPFVLGQWAVIVNLGVLFVIAIVGKLLSGLGAQPGNRLAVGVGMMPRGEVGLIFALFGLVNGILTQELYAVLVMIIVLTTIATPIILRPLLRRAT
ncbi:MAG: cation:proton antiporter [Candidatus Bipolaricaulota bacterium]|nr:cation:proton antiporter [Candidatus Bipolaricaulota bacterium]